MRNKQRNSVVSSCFLIKHVCCQVSSQVPGWHGLMPLLCDTEGRVQVPSSGDKRVTLRKARRKNISKRRSYCLPMIKKCVCVGGQDTRRHYSALDWLHWVLSLQPQLLSQFLLDICSLWFDDVISCCCYTIFFLKALPKGKSAPGRSYWELQLTIGGGFPKQFLLDVLSLQFDDLYICVPHFSLLYFCVLNI